MPSWLLKPFVAPLAIAVAILSLCGSAWLGFLHLSDGRTIKTLTEINSGLAGQLATCQLNNARLEGSITQQNGAVDNLKTVADLAAASAKLGQAAHESAAAAHDARAAALDKAKPAGADLCAAASELIRNTLAGEK